VRAALAAGAVVIVVLLALHAVNKLALGDGWLLSVDADWSLASTWNLVLFAAAALLWLRVGAIAGEHGRVWTAMGALCALLVLAGATQVHTRMEDSIGFDVSLLVIQPVLAVLVVVVFVLAVRRLDVPERYVVAAAGAALVLAQLMSVVNGKFDLPYPGLVAVALLEETFELATATLLAAAPLGMALGLTR
jgi:hypothetical protein